ncbi:hypothetical protein ACH4UT_28655 [Streptomyces sp. NPDC020799]
MNKNGQLDGEVTRWLGERYRVLLDELGGLMDIEAGLASIIGDPSTPS